MLGRSLTLKALEDLDKMYNTLTMLLD